MAVVAAPKIWNNLPLNIKQGSSLSVFKFKNKTHLLSLASDTVGDVDFIYFILLIVFFKNCAAFVPLVLCIFHFYLFLHVHYSVQHFGPLWVFSMLYQQSWYDIAVSKKTNNEYIH